MGSVFACLHQTTSHLAVFCIHKSPCTLLWKKIMWHRSGGSLPMQTIGRFFSVKTKVRELALKSNRQGASNKCSCVAAYTNCCRAAAYANCSSVPHTSIWCVPHTNCSSVAACKLAVYQPTNCSSISAGAAYLTQRHIRLRKHPTASWIGYWCPYGQAESGAHPDMLTFYNLLRRISLCVRCWYVIYIIHCL